MYDITGKQIEPGNVIAYPQRQGSSMWMKLALVVSTGKSPIREWRTEQFPYIRVVPFPVQKWNEQPGDQFKRTPRTSVLRCVENVVVVAQTPDQLNMPADIQSNLRPYFAKHPLCKHLV